MPDPTRLASPNVMLSKTDPMTLQLDSARRPVADYVWATDPHASHRVPLLVRADEIVQQGGAASPAERLALADKLERWRYQFLNERAGRIGPRDRALVDMLDTMANDLAGRRPRPPRNPQAALEDPRGSPAGIDEALECLDPQAPIEAVAEAARRRTQDHFRAEPRPGGGRATRRMLLYAPLYVSNYCINHCTYCGFRYPHRIERRHLSVEEAIREAALLAARGFRHLLLVGGDFPKLTTTDYYARILRALAERGIASAIEIAPQSTASYAALVEAGACGVTLYQETYQEDLYALYHPRGSKASFPWRLEGLERAAEAGMQRLGLGVLLGLADPKADLTAMMRHAAYLDFRFPGRTLAFSLPRIYEAPKGFEPPFAVDDDTFVRMYCALRIAFPRAELVLSTREPAELRNRLFRICITQASAGSCTTPGGYGSASARGGAGQQFPVCDQRSPAEVASWLREAGLEPVWEVERS